MLYLGPEHHGEAGSGPVRRSLRLAPGDVDAHPAAGKCAATAGSWGAASPVVGEGSGERAHAGATLARGAPARRRGPNTCKAVSSTAADAAAETTLGEILEGQWCDATLGASPLLGFVAWHQPFAPAASFIAGPAPAVTTRIVQTLVIAVTAFCPCVVRRASYIRCLL